MENQNKTPSQTQSGDTKMSTLSTQPLSPEPKPQWSIWKIIGIILIGVIVTFSLLAWYGFHLEKQDINNTMNFNNTPERPASGEASRQKATFSNPVMKFFTNLFNDTGSSNPTQDVQSSIEKQFDPQTYFSEGSDLLPLAQQIAKSDVQTLKQSLDNNPKLAKETNSEGYSLLHFAVLNVNEDVVKILLDAKADTNQIYSSIGSMDSDPSHTPLTYLLNNYTKLGSAHPDESKVLNIIDALDKHGAKLNFPYFPYETGKTREVQSPIFYATLDSEQNILKKLVGDGADINIPAFQGKTLLYKKLSTIPAPAEIKFLLDIGADTTSKANDGTTPIDSFCNWVTSIQNRGEFEGEWQEDAQQIAAMLKEKGATLNCKI